MGDEFIIRGSLEESPLPELLRSVCKSKESGFLTCTVNDYQKTIYIDHGNLIFATSTDVDDRLGESLLRNGKITIRNFLNATKLVRPEKRLGAVLSEQMSIGAEDLVEGVRTQVKDIIIGLFNVKRGPYELVLKKIDTQEMILLNVSTEEIIFEGIKTINSWSRISKGIASFSSLFVPTAESDQVMMNLNLLPEESHLLSLCTTRRFNVEEICSMSYLKNFETCRTLWALMMVGALEVIEQPDRVEAKEGTISPEDAEADLHDLVENYNDVYAYIYDFAFQKLGEEVDEFAGKAMLAVQESMPDVARNLRLDTYGRLDFDAILHNLNPVPTDGRMNLAAGALDQIVHALLSQIGSYFGPADKALLTKEVQKLRKT